MGWAVEVVVTSAGSSGKQVRGKVMDIVPMDGVCIRLPPPTEVGQTITVNNTVYEAIKIQMQIWIAKLPALIWKCLGEPLVYVDAADYTLLSD